MSGMPTDQELKEVYDSIDTSNSRVVFKHNGQEIKSFDEIWPLIVEHINKTNEQKTEISGADNSSADSTHQ